MNPDPDHTHHVRRVVLPSGRSIEVVYFEPTPAEPEGLAVPVDPASAPVHEDLHVCPQCISGLVYPLEWTEIAGMRWRVELRCPSCEWHHVGTYHQDVVDRFDDELDRGTATVVRDLRRLTRANMEDEIARFETALGSDAVWPMDF